MSGLLAQALSKLSAAPTTKAPSKDGDGRPSSGSQASKPASAKPKAKPKAKAQGTDVAKAKAKVDEIVAKAKAQQPTDEWADVDWTPTAKAVTKPEPGDPFEGATTLELTAQHKGQSKNGKWEVYEVRQSGVTNLLYLRSAPSDTITITLEAR